MKTGQSRGIDPEGVQCKEGCISWDGTNLLAELGLVRVFLMPITATGRAGSTPSCRGPRRGHADAFRCRSPRRKAGAVPRRHRRTSRSAGDRDVYEVLPSDEPQGTAFLPAGLDARPATGSTSSPAPSTGP